MSIKKIFVPVVDFLEANTEKKVKTILPELIALVSAKRNQATVYHRDEAGTVVAIRCFYHKLWFPLSAVEFGVKSSSPTGLNSMSKDGLAKWTRQQNAAAKAKEALLTSIASGDMSAEELPARLEAIEADRVAIQPFTETDSAPEGFGFEELDDLLATM